MSSSVYIFTGPGIIKFFTIVGHISYHYHTILFYSFK
jgi:hypothetical protein